jgi:4-hydroxyphenylpyruvate dioxygenase-like putative hemolysin
MTIKTLGIDHIHFNVNRIKRFLELMEQLFGPDITPIAHFQPLEMLNACVTLPETTVQPVLDVFEAATDSSPVARHIRRYGQGVSVLAFRVEDLDAACAHAAKCGLREVSRIGYRGEKQAQFDTHDELGFMLEFVEHEPDFLEDLESVKARLRAGETVDGLRYVDS